MGFLIGVRSGVRRTWITTIIFTLHLQLSSSGDACPPEETLNSCTCFEGSEMIGSALTTPMPQEMTSRKVMKEEYVTRGGAKGNNILRTEVGVAKTAVSQASPNTTCCTVVTCHAPRSLFMLEDTMANALNRKWLDRLILSNLPPQKGHTLVHLPNSFLKTLRVKNFEVKDTLLYGDFIYYGTPFAGQEQSMLWFAAKNCQLSGSLTYDTVATVHTKGLNLMPKIEGVDFSKNYLVYISATGFRYPPTNLSTIILSHNSIQGIEANAFQHTPKVMRLDLSHNLLEIITRNIFPAPARNLQHLDLSWNKLKILPTDFFVNMPQLKEVNLSNNFLTSLPNQPWAPIWKQLTLIDVTNNFVLCDCSLMWLVNLLKPTVVKGSTTTRSPAEHIEYTVLGSCTYIVPNVTSVLHRLNSVSAESLNC